jgi:hypothetical protein
LHDVIEGLPNLYGSSPGPHLLRFW